MKEQNLTLIQYLKKYSTNEACLQAIYDAKWPHGFICPDCEHNDGYRLSKRRTVECASCHRQTAITADTMFEGTHVALTTWFLIIYFVAQDKGGSSALKLANQLGMRPGTVHSILRKLRIAMAERDKNLTLAGFIEMDEAFLGGRRKDPKPGMSPFGDKVEVLVLVESEGNHAGNVVMKVLDEDTAEALKPVIQAKIEAEGFGQKFIADGKQFHATVRQFGHSIDFCPIPKAELDSTLPCLSLVVSHVKRFFKGTYHHFCRQNIQLYLDEFAYRFNRRRQWGQIASRLLVAAALCAPSQPAKYV